MATETNLQDDIQSHSGLEGPGDSSRPVESQQHPMQPEQEKPRTSPSIPPENPDSISPSEPEQSAAQTAEQSLWPAGFYYQDAAGQTQGPFTQAAMQGFHRQWPHLFHPGMMLWYTDGAEANGMVPLASVVGVLPAAGAATPPETTTAEQKAAAPAAEAEYSVSSYAAAVLAGLPEDDEAVQLARMAQAAGTSLQHLVCFQHQALQQQGAKTGTDGSAEGPTAATPEEEEAVLYQDMATYCSKEEFERFIAQQAKRRAAGQPPRDWRKLKKRRQEIKSKLRDSSMAWLRS